MGASTSSDEECEAAALKTNPAQRELVLQIHELLHFPPIPPDAVWALTTTACHSLETPASPKRKKKGSAEAILIPTSKKPVTLSLPASPQIFCSIVRCRWTAADEPDSEAMSRMSRPLSSNVWSEAGVPLDALQWDSADEVFQFRLNLDTIAQDMNGLLYKCLITLPKKDLKYSQSTRSFYSEANKQLDCQSTLIRCANLTFL